MPSKKREAQEANCQDATQLVKKQKQDMGDLEEIEFNFAEDLCYKTISASLMQSSENNIIIQNNLSEISNQSDILCFWFFVYS